MAVYEGHSTRDEIEEARWKRKVEGVAAREKGRLRKNADEEIGKDVEELRAELLRGPIPERKMSDEKAAKRKEKRQEHFERRRREKLKKKRRQDKYYAKIGKKVEQDSRPAPDPNFLNNVFNQIVGYDGIDYK